MMAWWEPLLAVGLWGLAAVLYVYIRTISNV